MLTLVVAYFRLESGAIAGSESGSSPLILTLGAVMIPSPQITLFDIGWFFGVPLLVAVCALFGFGEDARVALLVGVVSAILSVPLLMIYAFAYRLQRRRPWDGPVALTLMGISCVLSMGIGLFVRFAL